MSRLSEELISLLEIETLPYPEAEYSFFNGRRWKFDFAYPEKKIAIEVEGGMWTRGRHTRPLGFDADCEKYSIAATMEWIVIRVTEKMIRDGRALALIKLALIVKDPNSSKKDYDTYCDVFRKKRRRKNNDKPRIQRVIKFATRRSPKRSY